MAVAMAVVAGASAALGVAGAVGRSWGHSAVRVPSFSKFAIALRILLPSPVRMEDQGGDRVVVGHTRHTSVGAEEAGHAP